jgi:Obg family GTPase CgtA-like protein
MKKALSAYAEVLKPSRFWLDDDVRATNHMPNKYGCFCDNCIAKFNGMYGSAFTREELVSAINYGDPVWRERFVEFGRRGLYDFVYSVTKAILAVSPDTAMGYEFGHFSSYCGGDVSYVFDAMRDAGAKHIHSRPGAGNYNDKAPYGQFEKAFDLARENVITPDYVESMDAELENLPELIVYEPEITELENSAFRASTTADTTVTRENDTYYVEGAWLLNLMGQINFDNYESLNYFQRSLIKNGVIDLLKEKGIKEGDIVNIYDFEFEFIY